MEKMDVQDHKGLPMMFSLVRDSVFKIQSKYKPPEQYALKNEYTATQFLLHLFDLNVKD
jgi:hypothetical protein